MDLLPTPHKMDIKAFIEYRQDYCRAHDISFAGGGGKKKKGKKGGKKKK